MRVVILTAIFFNVSLRLFALPAETVHAIKVPNFESAPVIDGRLDEPIWKEATTIDNFYQTHPGDNSKPTYTTEVKFGYNKKLLFIGIHSIDDPKNIRARLAKRDDIGADD